MNTAEKVPATFDQASRLIRQYPQPKDIVEQLDKLRGRTPRQYQKQFDLFYEAVVASSDSSDIF